MGLTTLPKPGETIDRYRVVAEVARGGMAAVFAVQRTGVGGFEKLLAMKIMLPHLTGERRFVEMFLDEARLASQIEHPNVCPVLDVGQLGDTPFLLMELVRGRTVAAVRDRASATETDPKTMLPFWLEALAQAAQGLHAAHAAKGADGGPLGIVHRDISPQNLLIGFDGRVRVVDFGIAAGRGRLVGTRTGEIKGKFAYLAPEQISRDQPVTGAADVWALGVVAWELFAGRRLFADDEEAKVLWNVMSSRIPDLAREVPDLPSEAARLVMRCLDRDPARRPAEAREIARGLGEVATSLSGGARPDLAVQLERLFGDDRRADEARFAGGAGAEPPPTRSEAVSQPTVPAAPLSLGTMRAEPPPEEETQIASVARPREEPLAPVSKRLGYGLVGALAAAALVTAVALWRWGSVSAGEEGATRERDERSGAPEPAAASSAGLPAPDLPSTAAPPSSAAASVAPAPQTSASTLPSARTARPAGPVPARAGSPGSGKLMPNPF
jgi:serine/threonine-protein kinase